MALWDDPWFMMRDLLLLTMLFLQIVAWLLEKLFDIEPEYSGMAAVNLCARVFLFLFVMVVLFGWFLPNLPGWTGSCVGSCIGDYQTAKQEALEEAKKKDEQPKQNEQQPEPKDKEQSSEKHKERTP